jgi:hypothetical protein
MNSDENLVSIDVTSMPTGAKPPGFTEALTGQGRPVRWRVLEDASAPSGGKVIAETSIDATDYRFPICVYDEVTSADVEVSVRFKPVAGRVDQAGGIIVRLQDAGNYYVARANALEDNVNLYKVVAGNRRKIIGHDTKVASGVWHTLSVKADGDRLDVSFNGAQVLAIRDDTFPVSGKVGLWTKADSLTHFMDLRIGLSKQPA